MCVFRGGTRKSLGEGVDLCIYIMYIYIYKEGVGLIPFLSCFRRSLLLRLVLRVYIGYHQFYFNSFYFDLMPTMCAIQ